MSQESDNYKELTKFLKVMTDINKDTSGQYYKKLKKIKYALNYDFEHSPPTLIRIIDAIVNEVVNDDNYAQELIDKCQIMKDKLHKERPEYYV